MSDYPRLMWSPAGEEITVSSPSEEAARAAEGYVGTQPGAPAGEPADEGDTKRTRRRSKDSD